jgi:hypothetical protein
LVKVDRPAVAAAAYLLLTLVLTWPLARGLTRDVPSDLGDPLFSMWILSWGAEQLGGIASGDFARIPRFFDANIFYPAPLTLAYSEHMVAQALQMLPVYAITRDPILCYNLLFLSTFVLSGLGGFLLVRELTGSARAGFVAGLLFAFALYRSTQLAHLQVLSAQWMPFVLYGLSRYFTTRRLRPLTGAAAALVLQNLSCGYYVLYFAPFVLLYAAWEVGSRNLWRIRSMWFQLAGAALVVGGVSAPFLLPYKQVRDRFEFSRDANEVARYSADVYAYLTAPPTNRVWRDAASAYAHAEGHLFPGAVPLLLALIALGAAACTAPLSVHQPARAPWWVLATLAAIGAAYGGLAVTTVFARRLDLDVGLFTVRATNVTRLLVPTVIASVVMYILWPAARARVAAVMRRPEAILLVFVVAAWWLSLGPNPRVMGRPLGLWSPYRFLYEFIPGFEGVRAPARLAMVVSFALSMLGGLAIAHLERIRAGTAAALIASILFLVETGLPPLWVNGVSAVPNFATPEARVYRPSRAPAVYRELAKTPVDAVVLELPFGEPTYDVRSVYYSTVHWRRLVNGYSGFFPPHYGAIIATISAGARGGEDAWNTVRRLGVTHVVVHEAAYLDDEGARFTEWLRRHGATELFRDGRDTLLTLPH